MKVLRDTGVLFGRSMRHIRRSPDTIVKMVVTPVMIMVLFVYIFGGAIDTGAGNYVDYLLPGILLIAIATGISYTSLRLFTDVQKGLFQRFHAMPVSRSAVLWAHVLTSVVSNAISVALIVAIALLMGFRSRAGIAQWMGIAGMLLLFTLALTWVAVIPGLTAKSAEGSYAYSYPLIFLPFVSSAFAPTASMPAAVRAFAQNQPVTAIVDAVRALMAGQPVGGEAWIAVAWCVGIAAVAYGVAMRVYRGVA